jgi:hypothetical protein
MAEEKAKVSTKTKVKKPAVDPKELKRKSSAKATRSTLDKF